MAIGRIPEAGTGIPESIVDAKGDLITATAADTPARLAVGSNNQTLVADSSTATGLKYAASLQSTMTTTGDILYASAANTPARLGIGSANQVLTVSAGGIPSWAAASAGKVLQVVSGTTTSNVSTTSTSGQDTNLTASITPSATSSKILVWTSQLIQISRVSANGKTGIVRLMRGSTTLTTYDTSAVDMAGINVNNNHSQQIDLSTWVSFVFLDSPSTVSSTTYKTQILNTVFSGTETIQSGKSNFLSSIVLMEIGA
jgi:hypothetical protein